MSKHLLIIGSGSVGRRHARNLSMLGCRISCVDPRIDRRDELAAETFVEGSYADYQSALQKIPDLDGVVIASPPKYHVGQALDALDSGLPILLEKPVSPGLEETLHLQKKLKQAKQTLLLGYTWRWWEPLQELHRLLEARKIGRLHHVQFYMSAHLADWHPWEPYQEFFMSSRELGGGALLDESHWLDLMVWFFGMPDKLTAKIEKLSKLEIETDDNVDIILEYPGGLRITVHLDLFGRPHEKYIRMVGEAGTIFWSADPNRIAIGTQMEQKWQNIDYHCERNDMFVGVAREFVGLLENDRLQDKKDLTCSLEDGVKVMQIIEAARRSEAEGRFIKLSEAVR